jgi:hypothetical protein
MGRGRLIIFLLLCLIGCGGGGSGTEVLNTPNPGESAGGTTEKKFESLVFDVTLELPEDWEYIEYDDDTEPGNEAFEVDEDDAYTIAYLEKTDLAFFTIFAAELEGDEDIFDYVYRMRPEVEGVQYQTSEVDGVTAYLVFYQQEDDGERGGDVVDLYLEVDGVVLWARGELTGSQDEREEAWDEFWEIYESAEVERI